MKRFIIIGVLVFVGFTVAFAPAGIISRVIPNEAFTLLKPRGSLWTGQAELYVQGQSLGMLGWHIEPLSLLLLSPEIDWHLEHRGLRVSAKTTGLQTPAFVVNGNIDMRLFAPLLARYDLIVPGTIALTDVSGRLDIRSRAVTELTGQARWSGGEIEYVLSGQRSESLLPILEATLSPPASAVVHAAGEPVALMEIALTPERFIKIGLTKMFTKLLNRSWPGRDPDHTVVLVVEEQFF